MPTSSENKLILDRDSALAEIAKLLDLPVTMGQELGDLGLRQFDLNELASDLEDSLKIQIPHDEINNWRIIANIVETIICKS